MVLDRYHWPLAAQRRGHRPACTAPPLPRARLRPPLPVSPALPPAAAGTQEETGPPPGPPSPRRTSARGRALRGLLPLGRSRRSATGSSYRFRFLPALPPRSKPGIESVLRFMQRESTPAISSDPQKDPSLPNAPTMPPPEAPSEGPQSTPSSTEQTTDEAFQFLHCQNCKIEAKCPKLLPCLHTLCSGCVQTLGRCPICQESWSRATDTQALDNVFFESLQRRLSLYREIVGIHAACTRCKEPADYWCFECEQLICSKCFGAHQWFVKHEARPLADFRTQSVQEFLERSRKSNNIFCSNTRHHTPELTSIYCRACSKPLCCSCALLDKGHGEDKCDIRTEIELRQEELDTMAQALQEQDGAFGAVREQIHSAISQLGKARASTEKLIRARVSEVVEQVQALERELLQSVEERYQHYSQEMATHQDRLDAVLQRIHTGSELVQKMKCYASDQEVLDMHSFLRQALCSLQQEEPQSLHVSVRTEGFEELKDQFKERLNHLISHIPQETDAVPSSRAIPEAAGTPRKPDEIAVPEKVQRASEQAVRLVEAQSVAVVQQEPGTHPVPLFAFSIKDPSYRQEITSPPTSQKRKACQTDCPRKTIKMESEEKEAKLVQNSPDQPKPSTSKAVSPPHMDGPASPENPTIGNDEVVLSNDNHVTSESGEAEERIVVISSSEDSDAENSSSRELDNSSSDESSDLQLEGPSSLRGLNESLDDPQAEDRPLVFFDLKIDNETQKISQLAAVNQQSKFRVLIQPEPETFSVYSKAVSLEVGLRHFLRFLGSLPRPVLACHRLWGPSLLYFFQALEDMNSLREFQEAISGFLAILPLIQMRVPGASSFKLKSLAKTYLARNMNKHSALATVLVMRDLCRLLDVFQGLRMDPHIYTFSILQCFTSLRPLVCAGVLPLAEARLLALRNVSFSELLAAHHQDPQRGLRRYNHFLGPQGLPTPQLPTFDLQALEAYFAGLLAQQEGSTTPASGHNQAEGVPQQSREEVVTGMRPLETGPPSQTPGSIL
ncbi:protein PML [Rhynchocyon petersi]